MAYPQIAPERKAWPKELKNYKKGTVRYGETYLLSNYYPALEYVKEREDDTSIKAFAGRAVMTKTSLARGQSAIERVYDVCIQLPKMRKRVSRRLYICKTKQNNEGVLILIPHEVKKAKKVKA